MILELMAAALLQTPPTTTRSHAVFNHPGASKYQMCVDTLPCVDIVAGVKPPNSPAEEKWYKFPAMTPGPHTATVIACDVVCSDPSNSIPFQFEVIPVSPTSFRVVVQ